VPRVQGLRKPAAQVAEVATEAPAKKAPAKKAAAPKKAAAKKATKTKED
jgi:hypothetical protein